MVSRKDFKAIAEAIAWTIGQDQSDNPEHDFTAVLLDEMILQLSKLNPRFDEDIFRNYIEKRAEQVKNVLNAELEADLV